MTLKSSAALDVGPGFRLENWTSISYARIAPITEHVAGTVVMYCALHSLVDAISLYQAASRDRTSEYCSEGAIIRTQITDAAY